MSKKYFLLAAVIIVSSLTACGANKYDVASNSRKAAQLRVDWKNVSASTLQGNKQDFSQYKGTVVLVVNTASKCAFTPQFPQLQQLQQRFSKQKFQVIAWPSNDFGGQEPLSNKAIERVCKFNFGVEFPVMAKTSVIGIKADPLWKAFAQADEAPSDNFHKYLIGKDGKLLRHWPSKISPSDPRVSEAVKAALL